MTKAERHESAKLTRQAVDYRGAAVSCRVAAAAPLAALE